MSSLIFTHAHTHPHTPAHTPAHNIQITLDILEIDLRRKLQILIEYENIHSVLQQLLLFSVAVKLLIRQRIEKCMCRWCLQIVKEVAKSNRAQVYYCSKTICKYLKCMVRFVNVCTNLKTCFQSCAHGCKCI